MAQESGALYVRVGDTWHPALNLASARLIAATAANPEPVHESDLFPASTCDRDAASHIDWNNVDGKGIRILCDYQAQTQGLPPARPVGSARWHRKGRKLRPVGN